MPSVALNDVFRVCIYCHDTDQASVNTIHYRVGTVAGVPPSYQESADQFDAAVAASMKAIIANTARYDGVSVQNVKPLPVFARVFGVTGAGVGTAGAVPLPRQTSGIISVYSALAGRKNRGRMYVPFPASASNTGDGTPSGAYGALLLTLATVLFANRTVNTGGGLGSAIFVPILADRAATRQVDITSIVPRQKWATQRRRGSYGRSNASPV